MLERWTPKRNARIWNPAEVTVLYRSGISQKVSLTRIKQKSCQSYPTRMRRAPSVRKKTRQAVAVWVSRARARLGFEKDMCPYDKF